MLLCSNDKCEPIPCANRWIAGCVCERDNNIDQLAIRRILVFGRSRYSFGGRDQRYCNGSCHRYSADQLQAWRVLCLCDRECGIYTGLNDRIVTYVCGFDLGLVSFRVWWHVEQQRYYKSDNRVIIRYCYGCSYWYGKDHLYCGNGLFYNIRGNGNCRTTCSNRRTEHM